MYRFKAFIRRNANKLVIDVCRMLYHIVNKEHKSWLFVKSVYVKHIDTDVTLVKRDNDTAWITKKSSEPFRILTTTDIHLGDDPRLRHKAMQMLANHIADTKPDLVIFTGDIVLSKFQQLDAVQFAQFMEKVGVYWAITFGNHEAREEKGFFKWLMLDTFCHYEHCLSVHGDDRLFGYGNCRINIINNENSLLQSLFLFDSGRDIRDEYRAQYGVPSDMNGYDFLKKEQIYWYKDCLRKAREQFGNVKSILYFHIPPVEFERVMCLDEDGRYVPSGEAEVLHGGMYESIGCSQYNSGLFEAVLSEGSTQAIFCGHDHVNDFCAIYKGVYLVYNQCGGYETYTMGDKFSLPEDKWMQGVTITDIMPNASLKISKRLNCDYLNIKIS